jgi:hypothetical protein
MKDNQAAGYIFEKEIFGLLEDSLYFNVRSENLRGRGASHQIDAFGTLAIPTAFTYPIRLIAEAKCYTSTIQLHQIRSFVGVIKDISENYIVGDHNNRNTPDRYLDTGCFFSATPFSKSSQDYAWAQNIFLVSFSGINKMSSIITRIREFISGISEDELKTLKKDQLKTLYESWKNQHNGASVNPSIGIGVIDGIYPIILVGSNGWQNRIKKPPNSDRISAEKTTRDSDTYGTVFHLNIETISGPEETVDFNLPNIIAGKIVERIKTIERGQKIFDLDLPLLVKTEAGTVRRIIHIEVNLPDKERYIKTINTGGYGIDICGVDRMRIF